MSSDMKYWCATCEKCVGRASADKHSADGHVLLGHADQVRDRPHNFKREAARNARAFASTKSKDGQYPI